MRALFGRKVKDLAELRRITLDGKKSGQKGEPYIIIREVVLEDDAFRSLTDDFSADQPWIAEGDYGASATGDIHCIRVSNKKTGDTVLVSPEGYSYPRYVALEDDGHGQIFQPDTL